jgi:hypothetical protein
MPRTALLTAPALTTFLVALRCVGPTAVAADERWRRPLPGGAIVAPFTYERAMPYMHGRRRGIDIHARPGAPVLAVCSGRVGYAGRVPGFGRGVTIHCGTLVATELGLSKTLPARGTHITRGSLLGLLGPSGTLRLGARLASDRHAYVDPEPLLTDQPPQLAPPPPHPPPTSTDAPPAPSRTLLTSASLAGDPRSSNPHVGGSRRNDLPDPPPPSPPSSGRGDDEPRVTSRRTADPRCAAVAIRGERSVLNHGVGSGAV